MSAPTERHAEALAVAINLASRGWPVLPLCWPFRADPGEPATCGCGSGHEGHDIAKAPIGRLVRNGVANATTDPATVAGWWQRHPSANVGVALAPAGLLMVDPDSDLARAEAHKRGIGKTVIRHSRNAAYLFKAPEGCPAERVIKCGSTPATRDLDVLSDGYAVVYGAHAAGVAIYLDETNALGDAPNWAVALVSGKAAEKAERERRKAERPPLMPGTVEPPVRLSPRGLARWAGDLVQTHADGSTDRSESLFYLGLNLAEANATEPTIAAALAERDAALGWGKYTDRPDAEDRYSEIAEKAVAWAEERRVPLVAPDAEPWSACRCGGAGLLATQRKVIESTRAELDLAADVARQNAARLGLLHTVLADPDRPMAARATFLSVFLEDRAVPDRRWDHQPDLAAKAGISIAGFRQHIKAFVGETGPLERHMAHEWADAPSAPGGKRMVARVRYKLRSNDDLETLTQYLGAVAAEYPAKPRKASCAHLAVDVVEAQAVDRCSDCRKVLGLHVDHASADASECDPFIKSADALNPSASADTPHRAGIPLSLKSGASADLRKGSHSGAGPPSGRDASTAPGPDEPDWLAERFEGGANVPVTTVAAAEPDACADFDPVSPTAAPWGDDDDILDDAEHCDWPEVKVPGVTFGPGRDRWHRAMDFPPGPGILADVRERLARMVEQAEGAPL